MVKLKDIKRKTLALIEEYNPDIDEKTEDPDIAAKFNDVVNQIMFELARHKKIPKYIETDVDAGDTVDFDRLSMICGYDVYQIISVSGVAHEFKANATVIKFSESGTAEIELYVYPTAITDETDDEYVLEISPDLCEIMPYGVAADLLKSDVSAEYGTVYATRYREMVNMLDPRYGTISAYVTGGVD